MKLADRITYTIARAALNRIIRRNPHLIVPLLIEGRKFAEQHLTQETYRDGVAAWEQVREDKP